MKPWVWLFCILNTQIQWTICELTDLMALPEVDILQQNLSTGPSQFCPVVRASAGGLRIAGSILAKGFYLVG